MRKAIVSIFVLVLLTAGYSFGQRLTGGLNIQISDPQGAAVSDVKASVLGKERGNKLAIPKGR
jgi:hypothetical protein